METLWLLLPYGRKYCMFSIHEYFYERFQQIYSQTLSWVICFVLGDEFHEPFFKILYRVG